MKTFIPSGIFSLLILFSVTQNIIAQNKSLHFEHIVIEEGLANTFVTAILQDRKGFLWVGTIGGLYKYDGYSFTKYQYDPLDSNSLSQNLIYTIFEDKAGIIWTSSFEGLCKFDRSTEKFTRYKPSSDGIFSNPNIYAINEDTDGMIWVGTTTGELCRFDRKTGKFLEESFDLDFDRLPGDTSPSIAYINNIYKDQSGILWVGNSTGLHALKLTGAIAGQPSAVSITHYRHDEFNPNSISSNLVGSVIEDQAGIIWVATDNGLNSFNRKTGIFELYQHDSENSHSISSNNLVFFPNPEIKEDPEGNLWIGTRNGLNKLNKDRTLFTTYHNNPTDANSISSDIINSVEIDLAGILWTGASGGKLNKVDLNKKAFELISHDPDNSNSLSNNTVSAIVEDAAGIIWISTYGGGLNRWDKKANQFTHYKHDPNNPRTLKHNYIGAMLEDRTGNLWVCNGEFLSKFNKLTGEFTHYSDVRNNENSHERILSLTEDWHGLLWLGLGGSGVKTFDKKSGNFERYYYSPANTNGISDYVAQKVFADSKNNIWIGHGSMATDKYNKHTGRFTHYKHDLHDSTSISSNIVSSFYEDPNGNIWMGTSAGGLCYFDYHQEKFTTYTNKHGLPDNSLYSILNDNKNNLWLATGSGLSRFDPVTKIFTNYDYKDGLQSSFGGATLKGKDGTLYFGGDNGFNFFDPLEIEADSTVAPIVITQFKLFDKLIKGASESKEIVLDYDQNYFSFEFSSLSFYNPSKNQYAYQLEGFDKDWVYSGSRRYVGYTYVDPGEYTFKVKGTNSDGVWNETGTSIIIKIRPPWWHTWWAYSFYGVCFIAVIIVAGRYQRIRVINKEREHTRERERERTHEIERAYHELKTTQSQLIQSEKMASLGELTAGIAHEIQNPLNFVNNFSEVNEELLVEMKDELDKGNLNDAKTIANSAIENQQKILHHGKRADAIVKGMLQHSRSSSGTKEPTDINILTDEYLRLAYHGMRAKDNTFNVTLKTDFEKALGLVDVIPQDMGRVILNLITNAFYAVTEKGIRGDEEGFEPTVWVSTKKMADKVLIGVKDNGNGIPKDVVDKIFQPFFTTKPTGQGTGLGLSLSYDIVKAHGGELRVETKEGKGSEFVIQLTV